MHAKLFVAGLTLLIGCATPTVVGDIGHAAAVQAERDADARAADQLTLARELPATPPDVAAAFVTLLAEDGTDAAREGCLLFSDLAAVQFAITHHAVTCIAAMTALHGQVSDPSTYVDDLTVPTTAWTQAGDTATLNGCALSWSGLFTDTPVVAPGPPLGLVTLVRLDGEGWQITSYQPC